MFLLLEVLKNIINIFFKTIHYSLYLRGRRMAAILKFLFKTMAKKSLPRISGKYTVQGLDSTVEILRDKWGVPHIYAKTDDDAFFALGFCHAQDRLWQMELLRRTSSGTLSELFGELSLDTDRTIRTFGFRRLAIADLPQLSEKMQSTLKNYAAGVNAYLNSSDFKLPLEFTLIKHKPALWTPEDSLTFGRFMQWQLTTYGAIKLVWGHIAMKVGEEKLKQLDPQYPGTNPAVIPNGIEMNLRDEHGILKAIQGPFIGKGGASNAWSIAGSRTVSGKPIHCSDPHLGPNMPPIWYLCHIQSPGFSVMGVCPPTLPLILIGHNARISWGFTVGYLDSEDFFIEKINPDNATQYEFKGEWKDAQVIEEKIAVKGKSEPIIEKVMITHHGPVISSLIGFPEKKLAYASIAFRPSKAFDGFAQLNQAQNWDDFVNAISLIDVPQQNVTYADVEGNIGSYMSGRVPIRVSGSNPIPVPGWTGDHEWTTDIPFEMMPHQLNPQREMIVTANNRPLIDPNYKYYLGSIWDPGYRAKRITEIIESKAKMSTADCKLIHPDVRCGAAIDFLSRLQKWNPHFTDLDARLAFSYLKEWDGILDISSIPGSIYEVIMRKLFLIIFEKPLGLPLTTEYIGKGYHPVLKATNEYFHSSYVTIFTLLDNPESWWIQQAGGRDSILESAFRDAIAQLRKDFGNDPAKWKWGNLNKLVYPHAMAMQKPLDKVFNVGPVPIGGDLHTVQQMGSSMESFGEKLWTPSYRHIVDLSDLSKSFVIFPPGNSGNLASPHYRDLFEYYCKGEYIPMLWTREQVESNLEGKLDLSKE
jgi:penicillin amidase